MIDWLFSNWFEDKKIENINNFNIGLFPFCLKKKKSPIIIYVAFSENEAIKQLYSGC